MPANKRVNVLKPDIARNESSRTLSGIADYLTADQFKLLEQLMIPVRYAANDHLFWEGDKTEHLYYIRKGKVKLRKSTEEGRDFILSIVQDGDLICETVNGDDNMHTYSAEITEQAEIGVISWREFEQLLKQNGDLAIRFMNWMAIEHRVTQSKFRDLLLFGKAGALASTLIRLCNTYGVTTPEGIRIDLKLTHTELADFIGTTRESVNRLINTFKNDGIMDISRGKIIVKQLEALRRICQCPSCPACPKEICKI